jgi:hypothetical protein
LRRILPRGVSHKEVMWIGGGKTYAMLLRYFCTRHRATFFRSCLGAAQFRDLRRCAAACNNRGECYRHTSWRSKPYSAIQ